MISTPDRYEDSVESGEDTRALDRFLYGHLHTATSGRPASIHRPSLTGR